MLIKQNERKRTWPPGKAPISRLTSSGINLLKTQAGLHYLWPLSIRLCPPPDLLHGLPPGILVRPGHEHWPDVLYQSWKGRGGLRWEPWHLPQQDWRDKGCHGKGAQASPQRCPEGSTVPEGGWVVGSMSDHEGIRKITEAPSHDGTKPHNL